MTVWPAKPAPLSDMYTSLGSGWFDVSDLWCGIGGRTVVIDANSFKIDDAIGRRSTASFNVDDGLIALSSYVFGELVEIWSAGGLNLVTPNQSNIENGTTGITTFATGATITSDATHVWPGDGGTHSLKLVTDGTHDSGFSISLSPTLYVAGATYTVSCWLFATVDTPLHMALRQFTAAHDLSATDFVLPGGAWTRVSVSGAVPFPATANNLGMYVETTGGTSGVVTLWADGFQIEQDDRPRPWHLGGTKGGSILFAGALMGAKRSRIGSSGIYPTSITTVDWHWLADKRVAATSYAYQTCGAMFRNLVDTYLAAEGVTYVRGVNLLYGLQSDIETAPVIGTDFFQKGAGTVTITQDTANAFHGTGCLKTVTTGGANAHQGWEAPNFVTSAFPYGGTIVGSVWLKASSGTPTVQLFIGSSGGVLGTAVNCALTTTYQRFTVAAQVPWPITQTYFSLAVDTGATAQAITFYADELQLEIASASAWAPGGYGANLLTLQQADAESSDLTAFAAQASGTTLAIDATTSWNGSQSLKVTCSGSVAFQGVYTAPIPVAGTPLANGKLCTISFYAKSSTTPNIYLLVPGQAQGQFWQLGPTWTRYTFSVTLASLGSTLQMGFLTPTAENTIVWLDGLQMEVSAAPTAWELGGQTATIQDGPNIINYAVPYVPCSKAFDDLAQYAGFYWVIDANKVAWFQLPTTQVAPWTYDGTQAIAGSQTIDTTSPLYRNSQWLTNIPDVTARQTETRKGDGTTRAFTMSYPFNSVPTVTVNGTAKSVGIKGIDDNTHSKNFYWSKSDPVLAQEQNDTVLGTGDTLSVVYVGQWVSNVYSQDIVAVGALAGVDGTTGIVEEAHNDPSINTSQQGFTLAAALLNRYKIQGVELVFSTRCYGLGPGQLLNVSLLSAGWNMPSAQALIESVSMTIDGPWMVWTVTAIVGPYDANWVTFFQRLAAVGNAAPVSVGTNQNVSLLVPATATWPTWSASLTVTVFACPIIASSLHCGPTVKVC